MAKPVILVIETAETLRHTLGELLVRQNFEVISTSERTDLFQLVEDEQPDMAILGPSAVDTGNAVELALQIRQSDRRIPLLLLTSNSSEELAIAALRAGINEYVKHPFCPEELGAAVNRCLAHRTHEGSPMKITTPGLIGGERMIGDSAPMREVRAYLAKVGSTHSNVLVTGETGTGKELAAELVHKNSPRRDEAFITINCAAIPDGLLESELFGYERGAFTGAQSANEGKLKAAQGGTVLLDEIGDLSAYAQAKMLRLIESKEIQRLGGKSGISVNLRIIAASNQDLERLVREDKFRKDLYFRLNVVRIHLPPLRDHKEDIPSLLDYYIRDLNGRFGRQVQRLTPQALEYLLLYDWPGNVRELKNLLEAVFVDLCSAEISAAELPPQFRRRCADLKALAPDERERLLSALLATNWNKSKAADKLRWSRMTLYRKIAKYRIQTG